MSNRRFSAGSLPALMLSAALALPPFLLPAAVALPPLIPQAAAQAGAHQPGPGPGQSQTVNINAADAETISQALAGVGHSRARAIVEYRDEFGPFFSVDDLLEVKGIGPSIVAKNRDRITLE